MNPDTRHLDRTSGITPALLLLLLAFTSLAHASTLTTRQAGDRLLLVEVATDPPQLAEGPGLPAGFFRASIGDLPSTHEAGRPELPYRSFLVGIPAGTSVEVSAHSEAAMRLGRYRLAPYSAPGGWNLGDAPAAAPAATDLKALEDPAVYAAKHAFPGALAVVSSTGMMRDQRIAEVRVYPIQYDPSDDTVVHHRRIQVQVRFVEDEAARLPARLDPAPEVGPKHLRAFDAMLHSLVNYNMVKKDRAATRLLLADSGDPAVDAAQATVPASLAGSSGTVKFYVKADGIYEILPADLTAAGVDLSMVDSSTFHMTAGGQDVAIAVFDNGDGSFDPGENLLFYGQSIKGNRYTRTNVYQLSYGGAAGPRMTFRDARFSGGGGSTPAWFQTTLHAEQDLRYTAIVRPGVNEAWYWKVQSNGDPNSDPSTYPFTLPHPDPSTHTITVRAHMLGLTNGDHTSALSLNSSLIGTDTFNGQVLYTQTATASSSLLLNGSNTMEIDMVPNGNPVDLLAGDWFEVDYRRTYDVDNDYLEFEGQNTGKQWFQIPGFTTPYIWLMDITDPIDPVLLMSEPAVAAGMTWTLPFQDILASTHRYAASSIFALRKPASTVLDVPSNLMSSSNGADYIIITDRSLIASMEPLRQLRQGQGLRAVTVATDDIYDEFNFGRLDPHAIKSFLSYAYANWTAPAPAYVLLAGDGHIDYRDDFGSGTPEIVPPLLSKFPSFGEAPSDNDFVAVAGGDVYPEMYIGRLPIRSAADANTIVTNIINYDTSPPAATLNQQALYVADNNDVIFQAILNNLQAYAPASLTPVDAYLPGGDPNNPPSQTQINATTDMVIDAFNNGSLFGIYMGHGNVDLWAKEKILQHNPNPATGSSARLDANRLTDSGFQSFLISMNCINGYFSDLVGAGPGHVDYTLAEEWMRHPNRGAIAAWAPSALGQLREYDGIAYELFDDVFVQGHRTLGPATTNAVVDAVSVFGVDESNVEGMIYFGDPLTQLAVDYSSCSTPSPEVQNLQVSRSGSDVVLTWDTPASVPCATYKIYAAENAGLPKNSFAPYVEIGSTASGTFTHVGAATDGSDYDYLVVIDHPTYGLGPLGHYGLF